LDWDDPPGTHDLPFSVRTDGRFETFSTYDENTGLSTWSTPYDNDKLVFIEGPESVDPGFEIQATRQENGTWTALADLTGITIIGGLRYMSEYVLTRPVVRESDGTVTSIDRLQLGRMYLNFATVGYVQFNIRDSHGRVKHLDYNSRRMNTISNRVSYIPTEGAQWQFGVRRNTEDITMTLYTDDITPFTLTSIDWSAEFNRRMRRV
jgi:hypothetical protein